MLRRRTRSTHQSTSFVNPSHIRAHRFASRFVTQTRHPFLRLALVTLFILASILCFSPLPTSAASVPITNSGFESGNLNGWQGGGQVFGVQASNANSGTYSAYNNGAWNSLYQDVSGLQANTRYTLTAWGKATASNNHAFYVDNYGGAKQRVFINSTTYQQYSITFTTGSSNTSVRIGQEEVNGSSAVANVDDFALNTATTATVTATSTPVQSSTTVTNTPTDDTDAQSDNSSGTNASINASQWNNLYVRFSLSNVTGSVTSAKFRLYKNVTTSSLGMTVSRTSTDSWTQSGTKPSLGSSITTITAPNAVGYVEFDVTSVVNTEAAGDKVVSFGVTTNSGSWTGFSSKEGSNAPQLVVTFGGSSSTPTSTPAATNTPAPTSTPGATSTPAPTSTSTPPSSSRSIGINIREVSDSASDRLFADAFKTYRIGTPDSIGGGGVSVDAQGWPTADFSALMWHGSFLKNTTGTYALSFNGQADISGSFTISNKVYNAATNTTTANATIASDTTASIVFRNTKRTASSATNTGLTNIKLMRPSSYGSSTPYSTSTVFTTPIKNLIAQFGAIRFMDYSAVNSNAAVNWADRVSPTGNQTGSGSGYGWQGRGAAWEYAIMLANETDRDAWITVPSEATDDYVKKLAELWKNGSTVDGVTYPGLESGRKLYVEYSNEVWNYAGAFQQTFRNANAAETEVVNSNFSSNLFFSGDSTARDSNDTTHYQDRFRWGARRVARRTYEISNIFREVWGDSAMMTTIRPVLAWQQGNGSETARLRFQMLDRLTASSGKPASYYIWGGGGSAYYNPDNESNSLTLDNIWDSATFNLSNWAKNMEVDAGWTLVYDLKRVAYEGGPSMDNTGHSESIKKQAWGDDRMKQELIEHQNMWDSYGGDLLMYFDSTANANTEYYQWGFTTDPTDLSTPKMQGIASINSGSRAALALGLSVPATFKAASYLYTYDYDNHDKSANVISGYSSSNYTRFLPYALRSSTARNYNLTISYASSSGATAKITVNGSVIGNISLSGSSAQTTSSALSIPLRAGLNGLKLEITSGSADLYSLSVQ